jgi:hypothetical protein
VAQHIFFVYKDILILKTTAQYQSEDEPGIMMAESQATQQMAYW